MRAQLLHLSGPERGRTVTYGGASVHIGAAKSNEVALPAPGVEPRHAQIDFVEEECQFHLRAVDGRVFVNGNEIEEVILQDGDRLEFGVGGPMARFRIYVPQGAVCKPVRRMLADARDVAKVSGGAAGTQTLSRDLLTQATPRLKIGVPAVLVVTAFLASWLGGFLGSRPAEVDNAITADTVTHAELDQLRAEQQKQQEALAQLARANAIVSRVQKEWSRGVCLLHGVFRVRLPDQSWFLGSDGEPFEVEYTGSGFLVRDTGFIVTNRHVVAPWLEMGGVVRVLETGAEPTFTHLAATFPGMLPIDVPTTSIRRRSDEIDVAVLQVDAAAIVGVPVLPLHDGPIESADQTAIVVGYPTGLAALLARADDSLVDGLRQRGASFTEAIRELAAAGQVAPLMTKGIVSEVRPDRIVYDASTAHGGSGGPVFGGDGTVIAVNYAILPDFGGANFGVPIRFAQELLP
ncbi:MAG: trypsin-like peptidase domain-containing protein [Planctomycetes bacterium]|nr:trypsin-like peptidase domain-containing protein [Planctomycetota bacterium]